MPDLRALLDDATTRPIVHPDPVGAVHARVRQRTARRRAVVAAGATAVIATAGTVTLTARADRGLTPTRPTSPTAAPATPDGEQSLRYDRGGRATPDEQQAVLADETHERALDLVAGNPDTFVGFSARIDTDGGNRYAFAFGAGVDRFAWTDEIEAAVGARPWQATQCPETARELDRMATEVLAAKWPSGAHVPRDQHEGWRVRYQFPCTVVVTLSSVYAEPADVTYARTTWGGAVVVRAVPVEVDE